VYHDNPRLQKILAFMKQVVKDLGDDIKILDVGSGLGNDSYRIIKHFPSVSIVGLEIILGGAIVSQRNHRSPRLQYLCADATDIPFADETFDVVYSVNAIEHAGIEMTREMARVLKHGGRAFVVGPSHEHYKFLNLKGFVACLIKGRDFHSHGIPAQEYRLIFQQYFTITDYQADYFRFLQERHFWNRFSYGFVKGVFDFHRFGEEILSLSNFTKRYLMEQYFTLVKA
jgi:SAM-dependent methyltransferase